MTAAELRQLAKIDPRDIPKDYSRWSARVVTNQGAFGSGTSLQRLAKLGRAMTLPEPGQRLERLDIEGAILDAEYNWPTIEPLLERLLEPMLPARGRSPGWLALVANGMGEYWFEVINDFWAATQTSALSLDDLAGVEALGAQRQAALDEARERLSSQLALME